MTEMFVLKDGAGYWCPSSIARLQRTASIGLAYVFNDLVRAQLYADRYGLFVFKLTPVAVQS